jgi:hypothetical protein
LKKGVCNDEGYICYFFIEVIKCYWHVIIPRWAIQAPGSL